MNEESSSTIFSPIYVARLACRAFTNANRMLQARLNGSFVGESADIIIRADLAFIITESLDAVQRSILIDKVRELGKEITTNNPLYSLNFTDFLMNDCEDVEILIDYTAVDSDYEITVNKLY